VRIFNNILVAPIANLANGEKPEPVNQGGGPAGSSSSTFANNIYFGGNTPPTLGQGDKIGDPHFLHASTDPTVADFHFQPGSPALGAGRLEPFGPFLDLNGKPRGNEPDAGAYQH